MGIFSKFSTLLRSNINDLIARAENPEKMLNQIILDMRDRHRDLLLGLGELLAHVQNDLIQHLLGILRPSDQIIDVGPDDRGEFGKDAHGSQG